MYHHHLFEELVFVVVECIRASMVFRFCVRSFAYIFQLIHFALANPKRKKKYNSDPNMGKSFALEHWRKSDVLKRAVFQPENEEREKKTNKLEKNEVSTAHTHVSNVFESYDALLYNHFTK